MKKWKALTVAGMVCALTAMPALVFGASPSKEIIGGSGSGSHSSSSGTVSQGSGSSSTSNKGPSQNPTQVTVDKNGVQTTGAGTVVDKTTGTSISVTVNGTTFDGKAVTNDGKGNTVISDGTNSVTIVVGKDENGNNSTAGLSQQTKDEFAAMDANKSMTNVLPETAGYTVQTGINLNVQETATGNAAVGERVIPLKWTGLTSAMNAGNMVVGYFDNATGKYVIVPIVSIDYNTQTIHIRVNGSGTARILTK